MALMLQFRSLPARASASAAQLYQPIRCMAISVRAPTAPTPPRQTAFRRFAPKTSDHTFTAVDGKAAPALTWDPSKGMPPKVNDTNYKKQNTYAIVHSANPNPTAKPRRRNDVNGEFEAPKVLYPDITKSPHYYARNDKRAFAPGVLPTPAQHNRTTAFNRPSLYSLIHGMSIASHRIASAAGE
jgi:hypothetical protein